MPIFTYAAKEKFNATDFLDERFVGGTFGVEIRSVSIEYVDLRRWNINLIGQ